MQPLNGPTLVFDLETQRLAHEVGGWGNVSRLGLSAAVTLDAQSGIIRRYIEKDAPGLITDLLGAGRVIGYNILGFDYAVLEPYGLDTFELSAAGRTIDLADSLYRALGFHITLDNVASATLGLSKPADGLAAVQWYRQGFIEKVLDYCEQDVRVTHQLWEHGRTHRRVRIRDTAFRLRDVPVAW
jgi:DEAD/DEAH box helicase domain-containing protein